MSWKFWKKEDDLALPDLNSFKTDFGKADLGLKDNSGLDLSAHFEPPAGQFTPPPMPSTPSQPSFQQPAFSPSTFQQANPLPSYPPGSPVPDDNDHTQQHIQKDLEVIAAKLDTIRAQLEMLNARMANLERDQGPPKRPWY